MTRIDAEKKAIEHKRRQPKLEFVAGALPSSSEWVVFQVKGNSKTVVEK